MGLFRSVNYLEQGLSSIDCHLGKYGDCMKNIIMISGVMAVNLSQDPLIFEAFVYCLMPTLYS